jgi:hypothetical protein
VQGNFSAAWEELGEENELSDAFSLPMKSLEEAVKNITLYLGLQVRFPPVFRIRSRVRFTNPLHIVTFRLPGKNVKSEYLQGKGAGSSRLNITLFYLCLKNVIVELSQSCGSGSALIRIKLKARIRIRIKVMLDPDPLQFADDKSKCTEYEPI